jgi:hypothetical protein
MRSYLLISSLLAALVATAAGAAQATVIVYTDQASFLAAVGASATDTFNNLGDGLLNGPIARGAGDFAYRANVAYTQDLYAVGLGGGVRALSSSNPDGVIVIDHFAASARAVGGQFFGTDFAGAFLPGQSIMLSFTDNSGVTSSSVSNAGLTSFVGFVSDQAIVSLTVSARQGALDAWPTVGKLIVADALPLPVPEPGSLALMVGGLCGLLGWRSLARRRS